METRGRAHLPETFYSKQLLCSRLDTKRVLAEQGCNQSAGKRLETSLPTAFRSQDKALQGD